MMNEVKDIAQDESAVPYPLAQFDAGQLSSHMLSGNGPAPNLKQYHAITSGNGPYANPSPRPEVADYGTWATHGGIDIRICGTDVVEALLALDLLRNRSPEYDAITVNHISSISLIVKLFRAEFGTDVPPKELALSLGARIRSRDAEGVTAIIRDASSPY